VPVGEDVDAGPNVGHTFRPARREQASPKFDLSVLGEFWSIRANSHGSLRGFVVSIRPDPRPGAQWKGRSRRSRSNLFSG